MADMVEQDVNVLGKDRIVGDGAERSVGEGEDAPVQPDEGDEDSAPDDWTPED